MQKTQKVPDLFFYLTIASVPFWIPLLNILLSWTGRIPDSIAFMDKGTVFHNIHHPWWSIFMAIPYIVMYFLRNTKYTWPPLPWKILLTYAMVINVVNPIVKVYDAAYFIITAIMTICFVYLLLRKDTVDPSKEVDNYALAFDPKKKKKIPSHYFNENTQIIGSTGSGKTHFVMKPLIEQTIRQKLGCFVLDVKSNLYKDVTFYADQAKRSEDVKYFDLAHPEYSHTYNPLYGDNPDEVANRVYTAFYSDHMGEPFYKELAAAFLTNLVGLLMTEIKTITFQDLATATGEVTTFKTISDFCARHPETGYAQYFRDNWLEMPVRDRQRQLTGLLNKLQRFCTREWSYLINAKEPNIRMGEILSLGKILILGTHSMKYSEDAKPLAIMALMDLSSQVANRFSSIPKEPFRVFLDEFYNIAFPGFINLINKCRESKVNLFLAHQSLGDLVGVSKEFKEQVMNTARNKIILGVDDPDTAEHFSRLLGTEPDLNARVVSYDANDNVAGISVPQVEKFRFHPNEIKEMPVGEAIIRLVPKSGTYTFRTGLGTATPLPDKFYPFAGLRESNPKQEKNESSIGKDDRPIGLKTLEVKQAGNLV